HLVGQIIDLGKLVIKSHWAERHVLGTGPGCCFSLGSPAADGLPMREPASGQPYSWGDRVHSSRHYALRIETTVPSAGPLWQYAAQSVINRSRFSNRSPRR